MTAAYVGLGSNLEDPVRQVESALRELDELPHTRVVKRSSLYRTAPVGYADQPDEVVLDRMPNRHMAFGLGAHRCLGSTLARRQIQIALRTILRRLPDYEVDYTRLVRAETIGVRYGTFAMPITFTPGKRILG